MKGFIQNLLCVLAALGLAYYLAAPVQNFYCTNIGYCSGGFFGFDLSILLWLVALYTTFTVFLLVIFGDRFRYWWIMAALAPLILILIRMGILDLNTLPLLLYWIFYILLGFGLGYLVRILLRRFFPSLMSKIS